jgi:hypothetical protein
MHLRNIVWLHVLMNVHLLFARFIAKGNAVLSISILTKMNSTKTTLVFRKPKGVEDEKKLLDSTIPKSTRHSTKWASKIFHEWQE